MHKETQGQIYVGRFAPSPSGPLHFGSLIAALASYLQARSKNGKWLVRIEDIDPPREIPGSDIEILNSLEAHGLTWDDQVLYQSTRTSAYEEAIEHLQNKGLIFYCSCTNKEIRERQASTNNPQSLLTSGVYPGTCRQHKNFRKNCAIRICVEAETYTFTDGVYGEVSQNLKTEVGDFVIKRKDGLYAYQLAVVVDDIAQGITEVVRGVDLLDSTPRQLYLYHCLNEHVPSYIHLPLALLPSLKKLSKQTGAASLNNSDAAKNLIQAMKFLGLDTPKNLANECIESILNWGIDNWSISTIPTQDTVI